MTSAISPESLPWLNLESNTPNYYRPIRFKNANLSLHSPHPSRIRHIRAFEGPLICVVDTDESFSSRVPSVLFPPNQYVDNKLQMANRNFDLPLHRDSSNLVTARPTLDTILAMKYFTGLRNTSFRDPPLSAICPVADPAGWETQLHELTTEAIAPVVDKFKELKNEILNSTARRPSTGSSMKRMYSSSGRLLTSRPSSRPQTCSYKRQSLSQSSSRPVDDFPITPELETQVFYLLGGILQNPDPEIIKTWLLTSTERERNLMISILRSALVDKDELNIFVAEASKEKPSTIVYTPAKGFRSTLPPIRENDREQFHDVLIVHEEPKIADWKSETRPPTSSTFRPSIRTPVTRPNTRSGNDWIPSESYIVKE